MGAGHNPRAVDRADRQPFDDPANLVVQAGLMPGVWRWLARRTGVL